MAKNCDYAIYNKRDELVFVGNVIECCRYMGYNLATFRSLIYKTKKGLRSNGTRVYEVDK